MQVEFDEDKRSLILRERDLDIADAGAVFEGYHLTRWDERHSELEDRFLTVGLLGEEVVIVVWTERDGHTRVITMWKANERERISYFRRREQSG